MLGPRAPRPHGEARAARRTAAVAFTFLAASALHLAATGVDLAELSRAFPLYALGGASILIFGTSRLLIAGMAGRDAVGGDRTALAMVLPAAVGAALLYLAPAEERALRVAGALLWSLGATLHAAVTLLTVARPPVRPPLADPFPSSGARLARRVLEGISLLFALSAAVAVPLGAAGRLAPSIPVHLVLAGLVITTIFSTASHILPRFLGAPASAALLWPIVAGSLLGPILMSFGLARGGTLLAAGGLAEGVAFACFGAMVLRMLARAHALRWHALAYAAAPLAVGVGGTLALVFSITGALGEQLATHALLQVYGFVGLFIVGASTDLYGPSLAVGAAPARRHAQAVAALAGLGLVAAGLGTALGGGAWARAGMGLYALALLMQLAGILSTHRRAERVVSRLAR